jgi:hypothetical protein
MRTLTFNGTKQTQQQGHGSLLALKVLNMPLHQFYVLKSPHLNTYSNSIS